MDCKSLQIKGEVHPFIKYSCLHRCTGGIVYSLPRKPEVTLWISFRLRRACTTFDSEN